MNTSFDAAKLALYIRHYRGKDGLREAAAQIGSLSISTLSRIENEVPSDISISTFTALCNWLRADPAEFFKAGDTVEIDLPDLLQVERFLIEQIGVEATEVVMALIRLLMKEHVNA